MRKCDFNKVALQSQFDMGILVWICCIFSEHLFLRIPLDGCFCLSEHIVSYIVSMIGRAKVIPKINTENTSLKLYVIRCSIKLYIKTIFWIISVLSVIKNVSYCENICTKWKFKKKKKSCPSDIFYRKLAFGTNLFTKKIKSVAKQQ